ncbi:MAG: hypothetical protein LBS35_11655 [Synergistaceae bacterium]|nr:hypothetical protein [Synergistaceae bacterium]
MKRDLTESERVEFLELAGAIGMSNVEDYLYMLMVFKRNEDRVNGAITKFGENMKARFDEMGALEQKIHDTLKSSISRVLGDGAREIGQDMGNQIAESAKDVLKCHEEFHYVRGQVVVVGMTLMLSVVAYLLGAVYGFGSEGNGDFLDTLLRFKAGNVILFCGVVYVTLWCYDHWGLVRNNVFLKVRLVAQILVLLALFVYLL